VAAAQITGAEAKKTLLETLSATPPAKKKPQKA
jgi:hypothetical protein